MSSSISIQQVFTEPRLFVNHRARHSGRTWRWTSHDLCLWGVYQINPPSLEWFPRRYRKAEAAKDAGCSLTLASQNWWSVWFSSFFGTHAQEQRLSFSTTWYEVLAKVSFLLSQVLRSFYFLDLENNLGSNRLSSGLDNVHYLLPSLQCIDQVDFKLFWTCSTYTGYV